MQIFLLKLNYVITKEKRNRGGRATGGSCTYRPRRTCRRCPRLPPPRQLHSETWGQVRTQDRGKKSRSGNGKGEESEDYNESDGEQEGPQEKQPAGVTEVVAANRGKKRGESAGIFFLYSSNVSAPTDIFFQGVGPTDRCLSHTDELWRRMGIKRQIFFSVMWPPSLAG
jgi:hypothetical protein